MTRDPRKSLGVTRDPRKNLGVTGDPRKSLRDAVKNVLADFVS